MILLKDNFCSKDQKNFLVTIKSYVTRRRSVDKKKKKYISKYWRIYGVNFSYSLVKFSSLFICKKPVVIEIGFGDGRLFIEKALRNPHVNFIGIEVYLSGIFSAIRYANMYSVSNIKIIFYDACEVLLYMIPNHSVSILQIFFPDPWHKKKHNKRRLINKYLIRLLAKKIVYGGFLHIITDCKSYSNNIYLAMSTNKQFKRIFCSENLFPLSSIRKKTKFEKKAILLDHTIFDYKYQLSLKKDA